MRESCRVLLGVLITVSILPAPMVRAQQQLTPDRKLFPKDWASGYIDFAVALPHNEPDLNRCAAFAGADGGAQAPCSAFARYVGGGYVELRPVAIGPGHRVFVFLEPRTYMGRNIPQMQYTLSMSPIAIEGLGGIGASMTRNLEVRLTTHRVGWLGKYESHLGVADLGKTGPLSRYTTVSARWYFGGYARRGRAY